MFVIVRVQVRFLLLRLIVGCIHHAQMCNNPSNTRVIAPVVTFAHRTHTAYTVRDKMCFIIITVYNTQTTFVIFITKCVYCTIMYYIISYESAQYVTTRCGAVPFRYLVLLACRSCPKNAKNVHPCASTTCSEPLQCPTMFAEIRIYTFFHSLWLYYVNR